MTDRSLITDSAEGPAITDPLLGEMVPLSGDLGDLIRCRASLVAMEKLCKDARGLIDARLLDHMDTQAEWTIRKAGYTISGTSPDVVDYDLEPLRLALKELVAEGEITKEARDRAIKLEAKLKVSKRGVQALAKTGGKAAAAIKSAEKPAARRISMKEER